MDKIIEKNEPETMKQINEQTSKLAYLNDKLQQLHDESNRNEEVKQQQESTLADLSEKMEKLREMAAQYGVNVDTHEENQKQLKQLKEQQDTLLKQKRVLLSAIETNTKKFDGILNEKRKEFEGLQFQKAQIVMSYNDKIADLRNRGREIQELIERVRVNGGTDRELHQILGKWEEANLKMFEKYPSDKPNEMEVLDEALAEMQQQELKVASLSHLRHQPDNHELAQKLAKEQEVLRYMEHIKERDGDLPMLNPVDLPADIRHAEPSQLTQSQKPTVQTMST